MSKVSGWPVSTAVATARIVSCRLHLKWVISRLSTGTAPVWVPSQLRRKAWARRPAACTLLWSSRTILGIDRDLREGLAQTLQEVRHALIAQAQDVEQH